MLRSALALDTGIAIDTRQRTRLKKVSLNVPDIHLFCDTSKSPLGCFEVPQTDATFQRQNGKRQEYLTQKNK